MDWTQKTLSRSFPTGTHYPIADSNNRFLTRNRFTKVQVT